ncbi:MAG: aminopeptidase P family protein [Candidatus Liptonbacteria bacterium]|nr:aminopeptidase P family protein [Candidatus Liptonbacteria bacterium]
MRWNAQKIERHHIAARLLTEMKDHVFAYLTAHPHASEYETEQFVHTEFRRSGLTAQKPFRTQIVAFNVHTATPHYFPPTRGSARLKPGTLVLLDIWGRLKTPHAPFADITWIAYVGEKVPQKIQRVFDIVLRARDTCLAHLKRKLARGKMPTGAEIDAVAEKIIVEAGHKKHILHRTGHCIGFTSPHGKGVNLSLRASAARLSGTWATPLNPASTSKANSASGARLISTSLLKTK